VGCDAQRLAVNWICPQRRCLGSYRIDPTADPMSNFSFDNRALGRVIDQAMQRRAQNRRQMLDRLLAIAPVSRSSTSSTSSRPAMGVCWGLYNPCEPVARLGRLRVCGWADEIQLVRV
jgi:hypothetical protein